MEIYNAGHWCEICGAVHESAVGAQTCFAGHGPEKLGEYLHFRLCPCGWRDRCELHNAENGNPEGHRMYWHREATTCAVIAGQFGVSLREAAFLYINI